MDIPYILNTNIGDLKFKKELTETISIYDNYIIKFDNLKILKKEHYILNLLKHESIPKVLDIGTLENIRYPISYIVMEYFKCDTLEKFLDKRDFIELDEAETILKNIRDSLNYIHSKGILHNDLNRHNNNVLICKDLSIKIIDFGISEFDYNGQNEDEFIILSLLYKLRDNDKYKFAKKYIDNVNYIYTLFGQGDYDPDIKLFDLLPLILEQNIIFHNDVDINNLKVELKYLIEDYYELKSKIKPLLKYLNVTIDDIEDY